MYFAALTDGLAGVPNPGPNARAEARRLLAEQGPTALHASLAHVDPATAARLKPEDSQRIARAWEVWRGTGRGLAAWQSQRSAPAPWRFSAIKLDPPRDDLRAAIAIRFQAMLRDGALQEVRDLLALNLDPSLPAMRAHGVPELSAHLAGSLSLQEAGNGRNSPPVDTQNGKRHGFVTTPLQLRPAYFRLMRDFGPWHNFRKENATTCSRLLKMEVDQRVRTEISNKPN